MVIAFDGAGRSWWIVMGCVLLSSFSCGSEARRGGEPGAGAAGAPVVDEGPLAFTSALGRRCASDEDCGSTGLFCLAPGQDYADGAGSPAGGLCTLACAGDGDCIAHAEGAVCATLAESPLESAFATKPVPRLCLLGCELGSPPGKCHGRGDLACRPFAPDGVAQCEPDGSCPGGGMCFRDRCRKLACGPRCNDDADCSDARMCDPASGLCVEQAPAVPLGRRCNGDIPAEADCGGGTCLALFDNNDVRVSGVCTSSCTIGQRCMNGQGACVMPRFPDYAVGDIAYCEKLCNVDDDCGDVEKKCLEFLDGGLEEHYGGLGLCSP